MAIASFKVQSNELVRIFLVVSVSGWMSGSSRNSCGKIIRVWVALLNFS